MKWTIHNCFEPDVLTGLEPRTEFYQVPLVRFHSHGEPTTITVDLLIPTLEKWRGDGMPNKAFRIGNFTPSQYRPFMRRHLHSRKGMEELANALTSCAWYLEEWDEEACRTYKEIRGSGVTFTIEI